MRLITQIDIGSPGLRIRYNSTAEGDGYIGSYPGPLIAINPLSVLFGTVLLFTRPIFTHLPYSHLCNGPYIPS